MRPSVAVLIVEDEPLIRMGTVYLIEDAGFEVYEAGSADAAIALLDLHKEIRLVFTDVDMPGSMDEARPNSWAGYLVRCRMA
jgi:CheY-like chemotaxis protein